MLETLSLAGNRLTALPEDLLTDCPHLRSFNVFNNKLRELPSGVFRNNPKLDSVHLSYNKLSELPSGLFTYNPVVRSVYFYRNHFRLNHHLCELVAPRDYMKAVYDFRPSIEVKNYIKENLSESFCHSSCESIPKNEPTCESGCIGTVYNYTCVEVNKTNPAFAEYNDTMVAVYLPAEKPGYSRQLVGIGQHGSVTVTQEYQNSHVGELSYVLLNPGYERYGFQYVRGSDGRRSPVGAEFSVGKYFKVAAWS
ncbi:platelet glycoprotein Ib alpha chain-like [Sycon ciliatum]|uniref:platelet glycoprotein Ib alpha chain-like n=1 Tax=Sycon ciliatum TaxID=27933 RepID=UPI0031F6A645